MYPILVAAFLVLPFLGQCSQVEGACGYRPGGRIISGSNALPHSWPWMAQINYLGRHHCGGALVSPQWIVTAAHCVNHVSNPSDYRDLEITLGEHRRSTREGTEQVFQVAQIVVHPDYDKPSAINNDVALIKLDRPALINRNVKLVCLPKQYSLLPKGKQCFATGWGLTIPGDWNSQSDILQQAKMPVVDDQECKRSHQGAGIPITEAMFCVGHGKTSSVTTCNTDSGGPIVCRQRGGRWFLQGVVSWGLGGCKAGYYSVNARVSQFTRWINSWTQ